MRLLVTGDLGLVGVRLVEQLRLQQHEIVAFDLRRPGQAADVADPVAVTSAMQGVDGVIHLAAISRVAWGEERPDLCERTNVGGTACILAAIAAQTTPPWLVFASSREIYGDPSRLPVVEAAATRPVNAYGRSKAAGERLVRRAMTQSGLVAAIVRLSSVYGSLDDHHDRVIPALMWRALCGEELRITGADNRFDFVHVDDTVCGLLAVVDRLAASGRSLPTVHLATGVATSLGQVAALAVEIAGTSAAIRRDPPRTFDVSSFVGDPSCAFEVLGWRAAIGVEQGMTQLAGAMRARGTALPVAVIPDPAEITAARPPRVSVVIPSYNSAWSIGRTLESVAAQTFEDYDVVIVDDGSTDDLRSRIAPFMRRDPRLRLVSQANAGLAAARNRGIAESRGDFVAPLDADDIWHPDYLATLVDTLDASPEAPFAFCQSHRIDEQDRLLKPLHLPAAPRVDFLGLLSLNSVGSGSAAVFRREHLVAAGGYDETLLTRAAQGAEDWKLLVRLAATHPPVMVGAYLVAYRLSPNSMSQARPERQLAAILAVIDDLRAEFPHVPARSFADARTMMTAWLLPAFLRQQNYLRAFREAIIGYAGNPLWWRNRNLWLVHAARLRMAWASLREERRDPPPRLAKLAEAGAYPFVFLDASNATVGGGASIDAGSRAFPA